LHGNFILIAVIMVLILPMGMMRQVAGENVTIVVSSNSVIMDMNLVLRENLTALPQLNAHVSLANSTSVVQTYLQPFKDAIQKKVIGADVSSIDLSITTTNSTKQWVLDENYSLTIKGANSDSGSQVTSRLDFVSMNVSQPLQVGGLEINEVGPAILLPALQAKATAYTNLQYYIDGSNPRNAVIPEATTARFLLLDFTWVPEISTWNSTNNILGQSAQWSFDPSATHYNLTLGVPSPEGPLLALYSALYNTSMSITIPANAWVNGNTVYFDTPTPIETAMPVIIVISLIIAVCTFIVDRRIAAPARARKKR
jgi:hypothetical protein